MMGVSRLMVVERSVAVSLRWVVLGCAGIRAMTDEIAIM